MYTIEVKVMPHKGLLDPQGKAVLGGLHNLKLNNVQDVRVGKCITLQIDAADEATAKQAATTAAEKLLSNSVMEYFEVSVIA
jgi:phosphoribosylformylglycinamidine synthase subunit PurS